MNPYLNIANELLECSKFVNLCAQRELDWKPRDNGCICVQADVTDEDIKNMKESEMVTSDTVWEKEGYDIVFFASYDLDLPIKNTNHYVYLEVDHRLDKLMDAIKSTFSK